MKWIGVSPFTWNVKSLATLVPPLVLSTIFLTVRVPGPTLLNVQVTDDPISGMTIGEIDGVSPVFVMPGQEAPANFQPVVSAVSVAVYVPTGTAMPPVVQLVKALTA